MENEIIYINILGTTLEKKIALLNQLIDVTKNQERILEIPETDIDELDRTIEQKESMINELNELDSGFTSIYERVEDELKSKRETYKEQIKCLQQQIALITDLSVKLTASEQRNKPKFETYFQLKSNKIKEYKATSRTATNYYKNMTQQQDGQSHFFDKKK